MKIGVYFCTCGTNISERIDPGVVKELIGGGKGDSYFRTHNLLCSEEGKAFLADDLRDAACDRVVIAACSPRDHEETFMHVLADAGMNPYVMQMVNLREQVAWVTPDMKQAAEKAARLLRASMARTLLQAPLERREIGICPDVLVIGAGPAGLKAALGIAGAGRRVVLVEKAPFIGGMPVRYEEVFPSLECGPCMMEPLLGEVLHGEFSANIEVLTLSEVTGVTGYYGNFTARIRRSPRHVDVHKCIGCGQCVEACPATARNPFNCNLSERKAMDFPFLGALPYVPFIDKQACVRSRGGECRACVDACAMGDGIVKLDEAEEAVERTIGGIVVAVGAGNFDCRPLANLGYGRHADIYTAPEFERIMASSGPTGGALLTSHGKPPRNIVLIHCVGSLDIRHRDYCSGICCQYALKYHHMIRAKLPEVRISHLYKEMVFPGKDPALYMRAKSDQQAAFVRYPDLSDIVIKEFDMLRKKIITIRGEAGRDYSVPADMVILCPAVVPGEGSAELGGVLDIRRDARGFYEEGHERLDAVQSTTKGIYVAGACQAPMDIQRAMGQGMAAAGYILAGLVPGRTIRIEPITAAIDGERCSGCRVCVSVCPFKAISFDAERQVAAVNTLLCQGCGTCVAACPAGVIRGNHFTDEEISAEIQGLLR